MAAWPPRKTAIMADAAVQRLRRRRQILEDQVRASEAQVAVARANRKQLNVQQSDLAATRAQAAAGTRGQGHRPDVHLGYTKIYAPLDGIVSVRAARQGEVLQAGEPIVTILDMDHLWVQADVEESYIDSVALNQNMKIRLAFRKHDRRHGDFQGRGERFRHAARRQPHQARYQNIFD